MSPQPSRHCERSEAIQRHQVHPWIAASGLAFLAMMVFILFVSSTAVAEEPALLDIQEVRSQSGITAWLVEDHSVPIIAMQFAFKDAGTAQDPEDHQGLVRMVSNTMDEGAGDLTSQTFQKLLQDHSITLSYSASRDAFSGQLKTLTKHKDKAFDLLKLSLMQPRFDEDAITRMRQANQSRIRSSLSDPNWIAARLLNDVAFAGHPYAFNSGGTLSTLEAIGAEDLRNFHRNFLGRNNLVVSVSGDITAEDLQSVLDTVFSGLPEVDIPSPANLDLQNQGDLFVYKKDIPQTIIELMQPGIDRKDPQYHTAQVLNFILGSSGFGSRLTEEIREKRGLTYGIYSSFYDLNHLDTLTVSTSTQNANVPEMLSLIDAEFEKMRSEPISAEELEDAKSYLIGSLPLALTSTDRIARLLLSLQIDDLPIDYLDQREAAIRSTSVDDALSVAQELLQPENFVGVLVGQPDGDLNATELETIPNVE